MDNTSNYYSSDIRIKSDICNTCNLLDKLDKVNFVSYNIINKTDDNTHCSVGIIAQDIKQILPSIVKTDNNGYIPVICGKAEHNLLSDDIVFIRIVYNNINIENKNICIKLYKSSTPPYIYITPILNPTGVSFEVKKWRDYTSDDEIFIIGCEVDDYHTVNMTELGMLGTACTKELYQIVKQHTCTISTLQNQLSQLTMWATNQGYVPPQ
jgi:Chaperone of endosialidase